MVAARELMRDWQGAGALREGENEGASLRGRQRHPLDMRRTRGLLLLFVSVAFGLFLEASAQNDCPQLSSVFVSPQGTLSKCCGSPQQPCASLAKAISIAPSSTASLLLSPGTYKLPAQGLDLSGRILTLTAAGAPGSAGTTPSPPSAVVIDCAGAPCLRAMCTGGSAAAAADAVPCAQASLTLQGLTVTNGVADGDGGCIAISGQSVRLRSVAFTQCTAGNNGGAVSIASSPWAEMENVTVRSSSSLAVAVPGSATPTPATVGGGGISITDVANATLSGLNIANTRAQNASGGGLLLVSSTADVSDSMFASAQAGVNGGCVASNNATVSLSKVTMRSCQSAWGGCFADTASTVTVTSSTFDQGVANSTIFFNTVDQGVGGGLAFLSTVSATVTNSNITSCSANGAGGGLAAQSHLSLSIVGSSFSNCYTETWGGALDVEQGDISMKDSQVESNSISSGTPYGAGVAVIGGNGEFTNTSFSSNDGTSKANVQALSALSQGGGIAVFGPASATISNCSFQSNTAIKGAGLYADSSTSVTITDTNFTGNNAVDLINNGGSGGGADLWGNATVTNCQFTGNQALVNGGGVAVDSMLSVVFKGTSFDNNVAQTGPGGAVDVPVAPVTDIGFSNCSFIGNSAPQGSGGAISMAGSLLSISSSSFTRNMAAFKGGALQALGTVQVPDGSSALQATNVTITATQFSLNSAPLGGGAVALSVGASATITSSKLLNNSGNSGGAVVVEDTSLVSLVGTLCQSNNATLSGGCISASDNTTASIRSSRLLGNAGGDQGGAVRLSGFSALHMSEGSEASGNAALAGGALWVELFASAALEGANVSGNTAEFFGGGLYLLHAARAQVTGCTFASNTALLGGAVLVENAASLSSVASNYSANEVHGIVVRGDASLSLRGGDLSGNQAGNTSGTGGAVWVSERGIANMSEVTFSQNSADLGAAVSSSLNATVDARNCSFLGNFAASMGGGGYAADTSSFFARGCAFQGNAAGQSGAGVAYTGAATGAVSSSQFMDNSVTKMGAGIYIQRGPQGQQAQALMALESQSYLSGVPKGSGAKTERAVSRQASVGNSNSSSGLSSLLDEYRDLSFSQNDFSGSKAESGQGTAFFDDSFFPSLRANCTNCVAEQPSNTIGSLPAKLVLSWQGTSSPNVTGPFPVMADMLTPVVNLTATLFDSKGQIAQSGYAALIEIQSEPRISGLLRATPANGSVVMPSFGITSRADTTRNFTVNVTVSSPTASFPSFVDEIQISFCAPGYYLNGTDYQCYICPIGSWCATGQGAQYCAVDSYTFYPGASSSDNCVPCPTFTDAAQGGAEVVQCSQGSAAVLPSWWLDYGTLNTTPAVYPCDISHGCLGITYGSPQTPQCDPAYEEGLLCSQCAPGYYQLYFTCNECGTSSTNLYILWSVLLCLLWVFVAITSASFHSVSIFFEEIQIVSLYGALNLFYPDFIVSFVRLCSMAVFNPRITGIGCQIPAVNSFPFLFYFTIAVAAVGVAFFACSYLVLRLSRMLGAGGAHVMQQQQQHQQHQVHLEAASNQNHIEYKALRGLFNWLDLCYLPISLRCLQVLYSLNFTEVTALGFAPPIEWWSPTSKTMFIVAVILLSLYTLLWPVLLTCILVYAKRNRLLQAKQLRLCLGSVLTRFEKSYFWWHLVTFGRRIYYGLVFVLLHNNASLQVVLILPMQVVRLGIQFAAAPFSAGSLDLLSSCMALAEILFILAMAAQNYLFQESVSITVAIYIISLVLVVGSIMVTFPYEVVNRFVDILRRMVVKQLWYDALAKKNGGYGGGEAAGPCPALNPQQIADWFRPYVIAPVLLDRQRLYEQELLLRVCECYERALGSAAAVEKGLLTEPSFGGVVWLAGFRKSQLFAALHQVVLAAAVKEKVVAEAPLLPDDVRAWADQLRRSQAKGSGVDLRLSRSLARFRRMPSAQLKSSRMSIAQSMGRSRRDSVREAAAQALEEEDAAVAGTSPGTHSPLIAAAAASGLATSASNSSSQRFSSSTQDPSIPTLSEDVSNDGDHSALFSRSIQQQTAGAPAGQAPYGNSGLSTLVEDPAGENPTALSPLPSAEHPDGAPRRGENATAENPPPGKFQRSLSEDEENEDAEVQPSDDRMRGGGDHSGESSAGAPLQGALTMRERRADVKLTDERPEELWPPPLEYRATWVLRSKADLERENSQEGDLLFPAGSAGAVPDTDEWMDALLDSMGLSLAFQESFGQLTLVEKKNKPHSMKRLFRSVYINDILGWLTSPACTMDDRKLFVDLIAAVREADLELAGDLQWSKLTLKSVQLWLSNVFSRR